MWTHMAHNWIIRKDVNGVSGAMVEWDSKHWAGIEWLIRLASSSDAAVDHNSVLGGPAPAAVSGGCVFISKCLWVLPVTGSLMLRTAVGSEQKAVYFHSSGPPRPLVQPTRRVASHYTCKNPPNVSTPVCKAWFMDPSMMEYIVLKQDESYIN